MPHVVDPRYGCWLYTGSTNSNGYGTTWRDGKPKLAHYVAWEMANGPVPEGKVLDHACRRRLCCNPAHLEPVSRSENERRKKHRGRVRERCPKGHNMFENGQITPQGGEVCRICSGVWKPK